MNNVRIKIEFTSNCNDHIIEVYETGYTFDEWKNVLTESHRQSIIAKYKAWTICRHTSGVKIKITDETFDGEKQPNEDGKIFSQREKVR